MPIVYSKQTPTTHRKVERRSFRISKKIPASEPEGLLEYVFVTRNTTNNNNKTKQTKANKEYQTSLSQKSNATLSNSTASLQSSRSSISQSVVQSPGRPKRRRRTPSWALYKYPVGRPRPSNGRSGASLLNKEELLERGKIGYDGVCRSIAVSEERGGVLLS